VRNIGGVVVGIFGVMLIIGICLRPDAKDMDIIMARIKIMQGTILSDMKRRTLRYALAGWGKGFLKVTSIIGLVGRGLGFLSVIGVLILGKSLNIPPLLFLFSIASACYAIYMYIMALKYCTKLEKATFLKKLVIIHFGLAVIELIPSIIMIGGSALASFPLGLILPTLYMIGALMNEKAFAARTSSINSDAGVEAKTVLARPSSPAVLSAQPKQMLRVECPSCGNKFPMDPNASTTTCPNCRVGLEIG